MSSKLIIFTKVTVTPCSVIFTKNFNSVQPLTCSIVTQMSIVTVTI